MASILARPQWRIGQVLLPEHFKGLESALTADAALRSSASGLPTTGLLQLAWTGPTPDNGILWVSALTAILPDGSLLDVPGNARLSAPLDLNLSGRPQVVVYAHVFTDEEAPLQEGLEATPKDIPRHFHQVRLSSEGSLPGSRGRICLGEFSLADDGKFRLSAKLVPALLRLDSTPYFQDELDQVRREIAEFETVLDDTALTALARGQSLIAVQRTRIEARKLLALLDDTAGGVHHHPYVLYCALRTFALELCVLDDTAVPWQPPGYQHHEPRRCFDAVLSQISKQLRAPLPESPCAPFELDNGRWMVSIPPEAGAASELFIAVRKLGENERNPLEGVRLASPERLRHVREHMLRGVRLLYLERPPFRHAFGPAVDFYRIVSPGIGEESPEWAHVLNERRLALYHDPRLEGHKLLLCWRPR
ncbi:MAG TPA: type VI secretion system baseplate subunit TssK [Polyangiaceae bacterium]|nr:type VI secretion system baseplate subunit TssK [Polyangiaceae bacterium]